MAWNLILTTTKKRVLPGSYFPWYHLAWNWLGAILSCQMAIASQNTILAEEFAQFFQYKELLRLINSFVTTINKSGAPTSYLASSST